jgi:hypothetical protein
MPDVDQQAGEARCLGQRGHGDGGAALLALVRDPVHKAHNGHGVEAAQGLLGESAGWGAATPEKRGISFILHVEVPLFQGESSVRS